MSLQSRDGSTTLNSIRQLLLNLLYFIAPLVAVTGLCFAAVFCISVIKNAGEIDLFPTDRVMDVQLTIDEKDWNTIRFQKRNLFEVLQEKRKYEPIKASYTYVNARLTIDGVEFPVVGVRKKGFIGSQNSSRPSLKIKLNHVDKKAGIGGLTNLTFNNNNQDVSLMSQFMGYAIFNAAGSPAPRCGYARVSVNGKPIGLYTHVETIRKPLLKREFGDARGTLYEGAVVDFYDGWEGSFEKKLGKRRLDRLSREKIKQLIEILKRPERVTLLGAAADRREWVPTDAELNDRWTAVGFDDSDWERDRDEASDSTSETDATTDSLYLRFPFEVTERDDAVSSDELILRLRYRDGFVAYLNGHSVASANAPAAPAWNARATGRRGGRKTRGFESFDISHHKDKLRKGDNVLAIHQLNIDSTDNRRRVFAELQYKAPDLEQAIGELVDLDSFYTFWAVEGLLGFWDGYTANNNNFFVYHNPATDKFHFLPWGADCMFEKIGKLPVDRRAPLSVKTKGLVAHKLYQIKSARERYARTLKEIMDRHWNEDSLLAETRRIESMLKPHLPPSHARTVRFDGIRNFIRNRRADIEKETADGMPIWTARPGEPPLIPLPNGRGNRRGTPNANTIFNAAKTGNIAAIKQHLAKNADINAWDSSGSTPLSLAALTGKSKAVRFLIRRGADVTQRNGDGNTALHGAAFLGRDEAVKLLLENGAEVNARNNKGETPVDSSAAEWSGEIREFVQFIADFLKIEINPERVRAGRPRVVAVLRGSGGQHGAELDATRNMDIWQAAKSGNLAALKQKLVTKTDVNRLDGKGVSPLSWAAMAGQGKAARLLIQHGAHVNVKNRDGSTPLHGAAFLGQIELIELLIESKADVNARNGQGETALGSVTPEWSDGVRGATQFFARLLQLEIDVQAIKAARPRIAAILREHSGKISEELK